MSSVSKVFFPLLAAIGLASSFNVGDTIDADLNDGLLMYADRPF